MVVEAVAAPSQQPSPSDPVAVVEDFLLARDSGDAFGATRWCAEPLELQDADGSWFVSPWEMAYWLQQINGRYFVERTGSLTVDRNRVSWSERLTRRGPASSEPQSTMTIEIHAVVDDGKIRYLSGPYPPTPFRGPVIETKATEPPGGAATIGPVWGFALSASALWLVPLVFVLARRLVRGAHRDRQNMPGRAPQLGSGANPLIVSTSPWEVSSRAYKPDDGQWSVATDVPATVRIVAGSVFFGGVLQACSAASPAAPATSAPVNAAPTVAPKPERCRN